MDTTMDHSPHPTLRRDVKPLTTSLPIARFPTTTMTTTGNTTKRGATGITSTASTNGAIKKMSGTTTAPARRRSGSSTCSGWSGIRPVERQLMRPWLIEKIDEGIVEGLEWVDAAHTRFRIPWKHGSRQGWKTEQDACLFMHWAQHTGRYRGSEAPNAKRWKANFRCALNSLPDVRELKTQSQTKGQNAFRVYEFLNERKPKVQHTRTGSNKPKSMTDTVKMESGLLASSPADSQDIKYPLTPNSCTTSGSPSGLTHQNTTNVRACRPLSCGVPPRGAALSAPAPYRYIKEEPLDQPSYRHSPVPSPAASFSSASSEDLYSPCSPPPAHQHTHSNISRNWMLHMENDSYRAIFPAATASPASLPVASTTTSTWAPQAATSSPSSSDRTMTPLTSFAATPVTSQASMFNNGRSASSQIPYMTMDIGLSSHIDYDSGLGSPSSSGLGSPTSGLGSPSSSGLGSPTSGLGSPSSSGLGSPSSNHSDMDYACSDDGSDVSVEISKSHIQEMKKEYLKTCEDEKTLQQYHPYFQSQQHLHQHTPTPTHNNNYTNLYHMSAAHNRQPLQHHTSLNHHHNNNNNHNNNNHNHNQFSLPSSQLAGDYGLVEALQNAFGPNIPDEMAILEAEEVASVLSAGPFLNVDYKITVKTGSTSASTIEANLTANIENFDSQT